MTCGVYSITSPSGRIYVGQSVDIEKRWAGYRVYSGCNKQRRLYASLKKYGSDAHVYSILEECEESALNARERYWQEALDTLSRGGLNCRFVSAHDKTGSPSSESRQRMSQAQRGKNNPNYGKRGTSSPLYGRQRPEHVREKIKAYQETRGRLVEQYDISGQLIRVAKVREFVEAGFNNGNISSCCSGRLKTTGGYVFRYREESACPSI